ncbi:hypothetical protein KAW18_18970 [candidate division WOR-3 bacterium]|nr:hypothetical protein [candidate division WOR-3 bacterium]
MYEYSLMVKTADVKLEALATATTDELTQNVAVALGGVIDEVSKSMKLFQGGDWEIISHQLTRLDRYLVASFLLRRPK